MKTHSMHWPEGKTAGEVRTWQAIRLSLSDYAKRFAKWRERRAHYAQLIEMDDHLLRDIGLSRSDLPPRFHVPSQADYLSFQGKEIYRDLR
jgi:uncharacterized protein YjiS (DUF1127 family)